MIRLIAVDLDGTLLDGRKRITPETVRAIREARENGVSVAVCSGRSLTEAAVFAARADCADRMVCEGGTMIADRRTLAILENRTLPLDSALAVIETAETHGLAVMYYAGGKIVTTENAYAVLFAGENRYIGPPEALVTVPDLLRHARGTAEPVGKLLACGAARALEDARAALSALPGVQLTSSGCDNFEALPAGADKGQALLRLLALSGLAPDECAATGDNENDLPMLRAAGFAAAMGNAPDSVKREADFVAADNNANGAAQAIRRVLERNKG